MIKLLLIFLSFAFALPISKLDDIVGIWLTHSENGKIMIFKIVNYFYGKIAWMKNPNDEAGKPKIDEKNPDISLRSRHILGLLILKGFEYDEKNNEWINGEIYDPKN